MTNERIKELRALEQAATKAPWVQWKGHAIVCAGSPTINEDHTIKGARLLFHAEKLVAALESARVLLDQTKRERERRPPSSTRSTRLG